MNLRTYQPILLVLTLLGSLTLAAAQGTTFTYQGRLDDSNGPVTGSYDLRFQIFDAAEGGNQQGATLDRAAVSISGGLVTAYLDFGPNIFLGQSRWLEIRVSPAGAGNFAALAPRQEITPTPYAIFATTAGNIASNANLILSGIVQFSRMAGPPFTVNSSVLVTNLNADLLDGLDASAFWKLGGNSGTVPGVDFLGTTDNQPLDLRVNNVRALRLQPSATTPSIIGGSDANTVATGAAGAVIAGGGNALNPNSVQAGHSTISGGARNLIRTASLYSTISGGLGNTIQDNTSYGVIGGGYVNTLSTNSDYGTIAGGSGHTIGLNSWYGTIGGGFNHGIRTNVDYATIAGGTSHTIESGADGAVVGGGYFNVIGVNAAQATIGGGSANEVESGATGAGIAGGQYNLVGSNATFAVIGGGNDNTVERGAVHAVIGGGANNRVSTNSTLSLIAGGDLNVIEDQADNSAIGGGGSNGIGYGSDYATIAGGRLNRIEMLADYAAVGGGYQNLIASNASYSALTGGRGNQIQLGSSYGTIGGGQDNVIGTNADYSTIGGGTANIVETDASRATIAGGAGHIIRSSADYATIPGGRYAQANSYGQLAYASSRFAATGDAQISIYVLRGTTSGAVTGELFLDGTNQRMLVPPGSAWTFEALVVGRSSTGETGAYLLSGFVKNTGAGISRTVTLSHLGHDAGADSWTTTAGVNAGTGALTITGTGSAGATIRWVANVQTAEVTY